MKECKKCGKIMKAESKEKVCKECKQKTKKMIKVLTPITVLASVVTYLLFKHRIGGISAEQISHVTSDVVSDLAKNTEQFFGGLSQRTLDSLAKETHRGVKAVIHDDTLEYIYKSASGKTINSALFKFDAGKLICNLGNGPHFFANSPRFFYEKLLAKIKEIS